MKITIDIEAPWYHGSNMLFDTLRVNSTVTQWQALAEAFSHKPTSLSYEDDGSIAHNGIEPGYLYVIDEPLSIDADIYLHPRSAMDENAEFITKRPLKVRLIKIL